MKKLRNLALLAGAGLLGWQYLVYRREKVTMLKKLRDGSKILVLDTGQIEYSIEGEGKPMLIAHGGMGGYEQGLMTGRMLNYDHTFKLIAPSRAGARRSDLATGDTFAKQAHTYIALLDYLEIEKVIMVGLSGGGISAMQFALNYPNRCEALVLVSSTSPIIAQLHRPEAYLFLMNVIMKSDFLLWVMQKTILRPLLRLMGESASISDDNEAMNLILQHVFPSSE